MALLAASLLAVTPADAVPLPGHASVSTGSDPSTVQRSETAARTTTSTTPQQTLAAAKALFSASARRRLAASGVAVPDGRDASLVLRDLRQSLDRLSPADRATARRILARPTVGGTLVDSTLEHNYTVAEEAPVCDADRICVHYVTSTDDASTLAQAQLTLATLEDVWDKEVGGLGYKKPLPDGDLVENGGDSRFDVYLQNLTSPDGALFGYCIPDTDQVTSPGYCVLDNDYSPAVYGTAHTPQENLEVTAAHEFFHAVQFAYDSFEDAWFMEGTAAWMEDEVYTTVNDNRVHLPISQMRMGFFPLDTTVFPGEIFGEPQPVYEPYGSWVFWRYLSESATASKATASPTIVRQVWEKAAEAGYYSTKALSAVLRAKGTSFAAKYATFTVWNRDPKKYFQEGAAYPRSALDKSFVLTARKPSSGGWRIDNNDHMSFGVARFTPGTTLTGPRRLRIAVDMADRSRGSVARVVVHGRGGSATSYAVTLDRLGRGGKTVNFRRSTVANVELIYSNTSTRFTCNRNTQYSCAGTGTDDNRSVNFAARAIR
ncbi:MAG: hypothetical protein HOQ22_18220 [Nocardioidaceae bacterium]|nr:hypothetical protein [Nocardioidaceae bacterium]